MLNLLIVNFFYVCLREQSFLMGMVLSEISLSDTFNQKKRKNLEIFGLLCIFAAIIRLYEQEFLISQALVTRSEVDDTTIG